MPVHIVVGGFFGDEGKGKITAYFSTKYRPEASIRTGATNAGHTVVHNGVKWKLRAVPSSFVNKETKLYIARGALIHIGVFLSEVEKLGVSNRMKIDYATGVITDEHIEKEKRDSYLAKKIGSTCTGVGAATSDRVLRRLLLARDYKELEPYTTDTQIEVIEIIEKGGLLLVEATQGYWLSLYHGTYPYTTSRDTTASAVLSEIGLGPRSVDRITVVFKAYITRVGGGPLPGEIPIEEAEKLEWIEYGTVTGRPRRVAPFNRELALRAVKANTATDVAITKLDKIFPEARCKTRWIDLPASARKWIEGVEDELKVPVSVIGTGDDTICTIDRSEEVGL